MELPQVLPVVDARVERPVLVDGVEDVELRSQVPGQVHRPLGRVKRARRAVGCQQDLGLMLTHFHTLLLRAREDDLLSCFCRTALWVFSETRNLEDRRPTKEE